MNLLTTSAPANFSTVAIYGVQNTTDVPHCQETQTSGWINILVPVYILFIAVLGIVFNVFVLMVFCLHKKPCTVAEIYLSNLAAADLILVSSLPFWAVNVSNGFKWPFGQFLCKAVNSGIKMNAYCSIYFLVLISIDRYVALVHPVSHNRMRRPKYAKLGCLLVWVFGFLLSIPTFIYRVLTDCTGCGVKYTSIKEELLNEGVMTMFGFIVPVLIISFCTVKIIQALVRQSIERLNNKQAEHKATSLIMAVLLAFLICWVPFHVLRIVEWIMLARDNRINDVIDICFQIFTYLAFFNSVLNPILYVIVGKYFRRKVREFFQQEMSRMSFSMSSIRSNLTRTVNADV